ncbi:MAG: hypothetical protein L0Y71_09080 [Gemmataceae bacterium]|nr:hypothetical protein [Gemmataceae bacterium]
MSALVESSMRFDANTLEPFLVRVSDLIPGGFGEREIAQVVGTAERLKRHEEDELTFYIEHAGEPSRFRIQIRMEGADAPALRFFAPRKVAELIDAEIKRMEEVGQT